MSLSEALSKLHDILAVIIGKSADEWRSQKQSTSFTSEWEWAQHLLSVHKTCCDKADCAFDHGFETSSKPNVPRASVSHGPKSTFWSARKRRRRPQHFLKQTLGAKQSTSLETTAKTAVSDTAIKQELVSTESTVSSTAEGTLLSQTDERDNETATKKQRQSSNTEHFVKQGQQSQHESEQSTKQKQSVDDGTRQKSADNRVPVQIKEEPADIVLLESDDEYLEDPYTTTDQSFDQSWCTTGVEGGYVISTRDNPLIVHPGYDTGLLIQYNIKVQSQS